MYLDSGVATACTSTQKDVEAVRLVTFSCVALAVVISVLTMGAIVLFDEMRTVYYDTCTQHDTNAHAHGIS